MSSLIELIILGICLVVVVKLFNSASFRVVAKTLLAIPAILLVTTVAVYLFLSAPQPHRHIAEVYDDPMNVYPRTAAEAHAFKPHVDPSHHEVWASYMEPRSQEGLAVNAHSTVAEAPQPPQPPQSPLAEAPPVPPAKEVAKTDLAEQKPQSDEEPFVGERGRAAAQLRSLALTIARSILVAFDEDTPAADAAIDAVPATTAAAVASTRENMALAAVGPAKTDDEAKDEAEPAKPRPARTRSTPPDWVDKPAQRVGNVYQVPVIVPPKLTLEDTENDLTAEIDKAVADYVEQLIGPQARGRVRLPMEYVDQHVKRDEWLEWRKHEMSPSLTADMVRRHVLLGFDATVNDRLRQQWKRFVVNERLAGAGTLGGGVLALVAMIYGYLRFDLATRGAYRRRIRWAVVSVAVLTTLMVAAGTILHDAMR